MKKLTRREFLRNSGLAAFLLSMPSLVLAETRHAAGLAKEAAEFVKEAGHVVATYGDMDAYYVTDPSSLAFNEQHPVPWIDTSPCGNCHDDHFFEPWWCAGCENAPIDERGELVIVEKGAAR